MKLLHWAFLPAALASLTLSSCSGKITMSEAQKDQLFLQALESATTSEEKEAAERAGFTNEMKIGLAHTTCRGLESATVRDSELIVYEAAYEKTHSVQVGRYASRIPGAGIAAYCPEYKDKVKS